MMKKKIKDKTKIITKTVKKQITNHKMITEGINKNIKAIKSIIMNKHISSKHHFKRITRMKHKIKLSIILIKLNFCIRIV